MVWALVAVVLVALYLCMAVGLGAVFAKVGASPTAAWVPVRRYVVAARAAELPDRGFWGRMRMRLSLRSVWHSVATQAPEAVPSTVNTVRWHARGSE